MIHRYNLNLVPTIFVIFNKDMSLNLNKHYLIIDMSSQAEISYSSETSFPTTQITRSHVMNKYVYDLSELEDPFPVTVMIDVRK